MAQEHALGRKSPAYAKNIDPPAGPVSISGIGGRTGKERFKQ